MILETWISLENTQLYGTIFYVHFREVAEKNIERDDEFKHDNKYAIII